MKDVERIRTCKSVTAIFGFKLNIMLISIAASGSMILDDWFYLCSKNSNILVSTYKIKDLGSEVI